jgi:hypothetical protein
MWLALKMLRDERSGVKDEIAAQVSKRLPKYSD